MKNYIRNPYP